jgi:hypothetical protein
MARNRNQIGAEWAEAMRRGDFERAWEQTDLLECARRVAERTGAFSWSPDYLLWNGERLEDRRVVVHCNHGLGDTLQFLRFVPGLRERARSVTVMAQPELVGLLEGQTQFGRVCDGWKRQEPPAHDVAIEVMELAYAFRINAETLPREVPYLLPKKIMPLDARLIRAVSGRKRGIEKGMQRGVQRGVQNAEARPPKAGPPSLRPPMDGCSRAGGRADLLRVGLHWAASGWDPSRSIPLSCLECFRGVNGARFFSLQQGPQSEEWRAQRFQIEPLAHLTRGIREAALAILELDLVITVDAMIAHLAGALGRPVWLLLKHDADWRWMEHRADSPWYPTMRIFRQGCPGDWAGVARQAQEALATGAV